ncbi:ABC transporter substrate-binding protein [Azorhizobium oxalatiphilum]|uniref:ABC transporter substrate-binding protein n=2 Tax=Azorhizobium oxalatiphilum TaxID=980631 RepID=A0A917BLF3_9HYPH|nr:ABC transporter substrate-binding protein [Azorhizobium oxalatiphilum]
MVGAGMLALSSGLSGPAFAADEKKVLRVAMTAADIPLTTGGPDNGFEGFRATGYTIYDPLVAWDLTQEKAPAKLVPGLAESWSVDPKDPKKWVLKLRPGVKFHDGSAFTADAVIWNLEKLLNDKAPQYDAKQAAQVRSRLSSAASWRKVDDLTVEITTKEVDSFFPYQLTFLLISSPAQFEKLGSNWDKFAAAPSGTGPFRLTSFVPRERAELVANTDYWDKTRKPKIDSLVLLPIPEPSARTAALLSGQVDWIEAPAPDQIPALKAAGNTIASNIYPHYISYMLSFQPDSPFADVKVRKAVNLAIDREGMKELLGGMMIPAVGSVPPGHPWFGNPGFKIRYDPAEAKRLLKEVGYGPDKPLALKVGISTSGSGQMQPLPMNEFIQQNLAEVGVKLEFDVMEWGALLGRWRAGAQGPANKGLSALYMSSGTFDPFNAFIRFFDSRYAAPNGFNWGGFKDPAYDALIAKMLTTFEPAAQDKLLGELHSKVVDDSLVVWIGHDVAPRGLGPKVKKMVQPQSWYVDFTQVEM